MTTIKAGTTSTTGFVVEADATGSLVLQSGGSNTAATIDGQTQQVTFTQPVNQPGSFMFRNKIINGSFDIWQRGTTQTSSGYGSADRWRYNVVGSTQSVSRQLFALGQSEVPDNPRYFSRVVVGTVSGAANYVAMQQRIESVISLSAKTVTVSFWAKADSNKSIAVNFVQFFGTGGSPSATVTTPGTKFSLSSAWQKFTASFNIPSILGKSLGTDNDDWLGLSFWFDAGSNNDSSTDSLGQQSGTFDIALVQLEEGSVSTPFEQRPIALELSLCQRYYENGGFFHVQSNVTNSTNIGTTVMFKNTKRANATITQTNTSAVNVSTTTQNASLPNPLTGAGDTTVGFLSFRTATSSASTSQYTETWTASSEL